MNNKNCPDLRVKLSILKININVVLLLGTAFSILLRYITKFSENREILFSKKDF